MFVSYFKLDKQPFGATPDPQFLFQSASHREALASLYCGFCANRGFTALIAEPGMGKTTLLLEFLDHIQDHARIVFLSNSICEPDEVLPLILHELGITPSQNVANRHRQLNEIVLSEARKGRRLVLIIDEAQYLSVQALEAIRLLTNFETRRSKLIQIVLAGQPQLADTLAKPEVAQLLQRISTVCRLEPFSASETVVYIEHRLKMAGYTGKQLFTADAFQLVAEASRGIPRIINTLCFNSLCICRARNSEQVEESMVAEAISDLQLPSHHAEVPSPPISIEMPLLSFAQTPEVRMSTSRSAWKIGAALAGLCVVLTGAEMWHTRVHTGSAVSPPAVVSSALPDRGSGLPISGRQASALVPTTGNEKNGAATTAKAPTSQSDRPAKSMTVNVVAGDTLQTIATEHLGAFDPTVLRQIQALNPRLTDPNHIESGRTLQLPETAGSGDPYVSTRTKP